MSVDWNIKTICSCLEVGLDTCPDYEDLDVRVETKDVSTFESQVTVTVEGARYLVTVQRVMKSPHDIK